MQGRVYRSGGCLAHREGFPPGAALWAFSGIWISDNGSGKAGTMTGPALWEYGSPSPSRPFSSEPENGLQFSSLDEHRFGSGKCTHWNGPRIHPLPMY